MTASHAGPGEPRDGLADDGWICRHGKTITEHSCDDHRDHRWQMIAAAQKAAREPRDLAARVGALEAVLRDRERELLELKGRCSTCRLHYAHSGPCDIKPASSDDTEPGRCGEFPPAMEANIRRTIGARYHRCRMDAGHDGLHVNNDGETWTAQPAAEPCAAHGVAEPYEAPAGYAADPNCTCPRTIAQPAAAPGDVEAAVELLAGVRCQLLHEQIACAYCANCLSWARHVALPQWGPGLARHDAETAARALENAADALATLAPPMVGNALTGDQDEPPESDIYRECWSVLHHRATALRGGAL